MGGGTSDKGSGDTVGAGTCASAVPAVPTASMTSKPAVVIAFDVAISESSRKGEKMHHTTFMRRCQPRCRPHNVAVYGRGAEGNVTSLSNRSPSGAPSDAVSDSGTALTPAARQRRADPERMLPKEGSPRLERSTRILLLTDGFLQRPFGSTACLLRPRAAGELFRPASAWSKWADATALPGAITSLPL